MLFSNTIVVIIGIIILNITKKKKTVSIECKAIFLFWFYSTEYFFNDVRVGNLLKLNICNRRMISD